MRSRRFKHLPDDPTDPAWDGSPWDGYLPHTKALIIVVGGALLAAALRTLWVLL